MSLLSHVSIPISPQYVDYRFTSGLEEQLDQVSGAHG